MIPARGFEGRRVAVFGLGRSGLPAARALRAADAMPLLWDDQAPAREAALAEGFAVTDLRGLDWTGVAALVLAPGAPLTHPKPHWSAVLARDAGVPVIGDLELFARAVAAGPEGAKPGVAAITGTNGKSTTTALLGWCLEASGRDARIGGNIGTGVMALDPPAPGRVYVIEASSYQLDLAQTFRPDVAVLLNLTPDHLDRHGDMQGYFGAKMRIFRAQGPQDLAVVGVDDAWGEAAVAALKARRGPRIAPVSAQRPLAHGVFVVEGRLMDALDGPPVAAADLSRARSLPGRHNAQNAAAAYAALRGLGLGAEEAAAGLVSFTGLEHRMREAGRIHGVRFINDSKATNADAARQALESYDRVYWIVGGRAKTGGIEPLADLYDRVAGAYLIGESAEAFAAALAGRAPVRRAGAIEVAVEQAYADARAAGGEAVVLLSPACASFDQFPDFEARGLAFVAAVKALEAREAGSERAGA